MAHHNDETSWSDRESEPEGGVPNDGIPESAESDDGQGLEDSVGLTVPTGSDDGNHYDSEGNPRNKGYSTDGSNDPYRFDYLHDQSTNTESGVRTKATSYDEKANRRQRTPHRPLAPTGETT
jgi:hypothetical protein